MNPLKNIFLKNWGLLVVSNILGQALGLLATIRIARELNPVGFGQYTLMQTTASLGVVVAGLGMRQVITRESARFPARSFNLFFYGGILRFLASIFVGICIFLYYKIGRVEISNDFAWMPISLMVALLAWELIESIAFGHEKMEYSAGINLIGSIFWVITTWAIPKVWLTIENVSLGFVILQGTEALVFYLIGAKKLLLQSDMNFQQHSSFSTNILSTSIPFYWLALMTAITTQLPVLLLAQRSGKAEVALFNIGNRLIYPMQMIVFTSLTALYPSLSRLGGGRDNNKFSKAVSKALFGITYLGTFGALTISLLRNEIVLILYGAAYKLTADAMAYQCWNFVLYSILAVIGTSLGANDKQNWLARLSTGYALISLPIIWIGSAYGATGLAQSILFGTALSMTYHWYYFQKSLPVPILFQDLVLPFGVLVVGATFAWLVPMIWIWPVRVFFSFLFGAGFIYTYFSNKNSTFD